MTDDEYRAIVIETILEMVLTELEDQAAVRSAWTDLLNLAQPLRAADESSGRALIDAANGYATALAQRAFLAGLRFDAGTLLQQAAAELGAA